MLELDISPLLLEVFGDEPPVALMRFVLAAEQTSLVEMLARELLVNCTLADERVEFALVVIPVDSLFLVSRQYFISR